MIGKNDKYKYTSIAFLLSPDVTLIERETYSLLEWLGDIGGLFDALKTIGGAIVGPFASYTLSTEILSSIFKSVSKAPANLQPFVNGN